MLVTFLVRSRQFAYTSYHRMYCGVEAAFDFAYIINEHPKTLEFKCLLDECTLDEIPGSSYKPSKLVKTFDYTKE